MFFTFRNLLFFFFLNYFRTRKEASAGPAARRVVSRHVFVYGHMPRVLGRSVGERFRSWQSYFVSQEMQPVPGSGLQFATGSGLI